MPLTTWVATFVVENGRVTQEGSRLRSFSQQRLDEPDINLHVLHEPISPKGEDLGAQAIDVIGRHVLNDRLSLTGALTRSLTETNQTLLEWNRRSLPRDQVGIGITAALVGENVVYLAQVGPSLVYLRSGRNLSRLYPSEQASQPLGEGSLDPSLRRLELQEGDMIIACSPALAEILSMDELRRILDQPPEDSLAELYHRTRHLPSFALFSITGVMKEAPPEEEADDAASHGPPPGFGLDPSVESRTHGGVTMVYPPARKPVDISKPVVNLRTERPTGRNAYARTTGEGGRFTFRLSNTRLMQIAAVALVALILVIFVPDLIREERTERVGEFIEGARAHLVASENEADPGYRRYYLEETRRLASEALRIDEANADALAIRAQANDSLVALDAVHDLGSLVSLSTLSREITGSIAVEALTVHGGFAYVLDRAGGRVIAVPVDGSSPPAIVYQEDELYGEAPARTPLYFAWQGSEEAGRLLVLDAERKLFEVRHGEEPRHLPLRRTSIWASAMGIAVYDDNLYVLDPEGSQVYRYRPSVDGYDSEPDAILAPDSDLTGANALAVSGDVYVSHSDGRISRFSSGGFVGFPLGAIDRTITTIGDIAVSSTGQVYIADTGSKRVVEASREGDFQRQFVSNAMTDISAIAIDPAGQNLYIVVNDQLAVAALPR